MPAVAHLGHSCDAKAAPVQNSKTGSVSTSLPESTSWAPLVYSQVLIGVRPIYLQAP